jgi:hypothetical protein
LYGYDSNSGFPLLFATDIAKHPVILASRGEGRLNLACVEDLASDIIHIAHGLAAPGSESITGDFLYPNLSAASCNERYPSEYCTSKGWPLLALGVSVSMMNVFEVWSRFGPS